MMKRYQVFMVSEAAWVPFGLPYDTADEAFNVAALCEGGGAVPALTVCVRAVEVQDDPLGADLSSVQR